jgi:hypothetical protein
MTVSSSTNGADSQQQPPALARDAAGRIDSNALADVIQWFLDRDPRVNAVRHPRAEEIFRWKQEAARRAGEEVFRFDTAEDRFAVGVVQALAANPDERSLHGWIAQLLGALDDASRTNEEIASAYRLDPAESAVAEGGKIPAAAARDIFLTCCWLEVLCTAEARVLGWVYQELYGRPFRP